MARSIWRGAISFGLVNVPVKLYSAVSKKTVRFNQLHDADHARIQQKRVCSQDGEEVPYENIVKGFEIAPRPLRRDHAGGARRARSSKDARDRHRGLRRRGGIDPLYYEHPYYLLPDTGAAKAYKLLLEALRDTNKVAIARVVLRTKEYLVAIRPAGEVLTMETMLFADELIGAEGLDELPDADVKATERELSMARQLIEAQATEFDPTKYRDEYRERVLELIERKAAGEEIAVQPMAEEKPGGSRPDGGSGAEPARRGGRRKARRPRTGRDGQEVARPRRPQRRSRRPSKPAAKKPRARLTRPREVSASRLRPS